MSDDTTRLTVSDAILVLDIGTTSARAAIFDAQGRMLGIHGEEYRSTFLSSGAIDHDPNTWLKALACSIPIVLEQSHCKPQAIQSIAVVSQRSTIVPVDVEGVPLAPAISWQDKRTMSECRTLMEQVGEEHVYLTTGLRIDPYFSLPKMMWRRADLGRHANQIVKFLTVHDFVLHQLTGRFVTDVTQASRTMVYDIVRHRWDEFIATAANVPLHLLPDVVPTGTVIGQVTQRAARQFGLVAGTPVVAAGGDQQCSAVGLGVIQEGLAEVTGGTGSFLLVPSQRPTFDKHRRVLISPSAVPSQYIMEAGLFTTGAILRWLRDFVSAPNQSVSYEALLQEAEMISAGSDELLVVPHFAGSAAPYWNADAHGVIVNLGLQHTRGAVVRATLEGIALEVAKNLEIMRDLLSSTNAVAAKYDVARYIDTVHVSGGLCRSRLFNQIQADAYDTNIHVFDNEQATARGAAMLGAVAMGIYDSIAKATQAMLQAESFHIVEPEEQTVVLYRAMRSRHDLMYKAIAGSLSDPAH